MKAVVLKNVGVVDNLGLTEIEKPSAKENEVLVEVKAISVNPVDYKVRANEAALNMIYGDERPAILGWDIAGVVVEAGESVSNFEIGDKVFGMVNFLGKGKAYAEYVAALEDHLAKIPENISFEEAAASTLAALTALQAMESKVKEGDKVLIHAGSGGVGHFAIQIAKSLGAYVIATSSAKNRDFVLGLGADEHIDYRTQNFEEALSEIDFVLDPMGGEVLKNSVKVLSNGGKLVAITTSEFSEELQNEAKERNLELSFLMVQSSGKDMKTLKKLLEKGTVKAHVSKTFTLEEISKVHEELESGRTVGKLIVKL